MDNDTFSNDNVSIPASLFFNYDIQSSTTENDKGTVRNHSNKQESYEVNCLENETISNNSTFEEFTSIPTASGKS